jgi:FKBP-type peptidyl-prolyl cis-trans isomerase
MKKILFLGALPFVLASCGGSSSSVDLKTQNDSLSYAFGLQFGQYLSQLQTELDVDSLNVDMIKEAMKDQMDSTRAFAMDMASAEEVLNRVLGAKQKAKKAEQNKKFEANIEKGKAFLANNKGQQGVMETATGLQYKITKTSGKSEKPKASDIIGVHYTLKNIDGAVIESSLQEGKPVEFPLNQVIPGWTEGMQLLNVGDEATLYVPQELAYGDKGQRDIEPYSTLIFEVQLICIGEGCTTK